MNDTPPGADIRQRTRALDISHSFIVQAPAGSGKTELLIQRYLALLAHMEAPEEIVAITFTRKAAAEMRSRILDALAADDGTPPSAPHQHTTWQLARAVKVRDAQTQWNIAANPNRLCIQTIDSLCAWLTRHMPLLSGFGAQPEIIEDAAAFYAEAARRTLVHLDSGNDWSPWVARILRHLDNNVAAATGLLAEMLARRDQWLRHVANQASPRIRRAALESALANATRDALASLNVLLPRKLHGELTALAYYAADNIRANGKESPIQVCLGMKDVPGNALEDLATWRGIAELLLTKEGTLRRQVDARSGFPAAGNSRNKAEKERLTVMKLRCEALLFELGSHRTFVEQLHLTRYLPPAAYTDVQWEVVEALIGLLPVAVAELEVLFRERAQVDFTALSQAAVRALGESDAPTDLALALDYRIRHILVDEFQDTSYSQLVLLERLTAGWQEGDGRTLFVVGDPMQSIYRFREADVGLYLRARRDGIGAIALTPLTLSVNFRSQRGIVEWLNRAFRAVLPDQEDVASGAVPYTGSTAECPALPGDAVKIHPLLVLDREAEARLVTGLITAARLEYPGSSVAILVRSRAHVAQIAPRLKEAGLRFQAIEIEALGHRPVVQDLLALTRAIVHPADRIAWLSVLRAPWCGLTLADLDALASHNTRAAIWELMNDDKTIARLSADGHRRLARVRNVLGSHLACRRREPLRRWIEGAWLALGGPACVDNVTDLDDASVFLETLDELDDGGDLPDLETLAERIELLYALPDTAADTRLQVMTIHRAKGLEFDTVILPGLGYTPKHRDARLLSWIERPRGHADSDLLLAPIKAAGAQDDAIYRHLDMIDDVKARHEAARLIYVATTRAKSRLHLIGQVDYRGNAPKPRSGSLLEHLWPVVEQAFIAKARSTDAQTPGTEGEKRERAIPSQEQAFIRRLVSNWTLPNPPERLECAPRVEVLRERASPHDRVEFSWATETAQHVGTLVHRFLQTIAEDGLERWDTGRIAGLHRVFSRELQRLGVPEPELKGAVVRVAEALSSSISDQRGRWVLGPHAEAQSELRLTGVVDGEITSIAIDRTFVDENGVRWIVDYKTGVHEGGDLEEFLNREMQRYRAQLDQYTKLVQKMDDRSLRLGLYFPLLRGWREWGALS
ncbi:MAG: UvrD-helicase domain-containing protein [Burkholderiales bacterium]